jgi:hypothetical protein
MSDDGASAFEDQVKAAAADARQRFAAGGPTQEVPAGGIAAIDTLIEMLERQLGEGFDGNCGHLQYRDAQPVHWLPAIPRLWHCDACAQMLVDEWLREDYHRCDLCRRSLAGEPTSALVEAPAGMVIIHAVACASCAPGTG